MENNLIDDFEKKDRKKKTETVDAVPYIIYNSVNAAGAAAEAVQVHYDAFAASSAKGTSKGLKDISQSRVDPKYYDINIKQQAGFSAEVKSVARANAEAVMSKNDSARYVRTDDMLKQSDGKGNFIGGTNDQLYDIAKVDVNGNYIPGSGVQMKFVGNNADELVNKLLSKNYDKYRDSGASFGVPSDFLSEAQDILNTKALKAQQGLKRAQQGGNMELAQKYQNRLDIIDKTKLVDSGVTNRDAIMARKHPVVSTAMDVGKVAHNAGVQGAKYGGTYAATMSSMYNIKAVLDGKKSVEDALVDVAIDTGKGVATGYMVQGGTAVMGNVVQKTAEKFGVKLAANSSVPGKVITAVIITGDSIAKYLGGEITATECLTSIGNKAVDLGIATVGGMAGEAIVTTLLEGTVLAGSTILPVIGAAACAVVAGMIAQKLMERLQKKQLEHEERMRLQAEYKAAAADAKRFREELERYLQEYFQGYRECFEDAFGLLDSGFAVGNANDMIAGANMITRKMGGTVPYNNVAEARAFFIKG